jgi:putative endonuclease
MNSKDFGVLGEKIAENYLKKKGYKILEKNYSPGFVSGPNIGEIDLIAKKQDVVVFVEVKTLQKSGLSEDFSPETKVNYSKQKKIIKTAQSYFLEKRVSLETKWQIDILSIIVDFEKRKAKIKHFENAII